LLRVERGAHSRLSKCLRCRMSSQAETEWDERATGTIDKFETWD
jgi:hypothetical protein